MTYVHISTALQCELMFLCFSGREISSQLVLCWQPQMNHPRLFCWCCRYTRARNLICGCGREELRVLERINNWKVTQSGWTAIRELYEELIVYVWFLAACMGTQIKWGLLGMCGLWHVEHNGLICPATLFSINCYTLWQKVRFNNLVGLIKFETIKSDIISADVVISSLFSYRWKLCCSDDLIFGPGRV